MASVLAQARLREVTSTWPVPDGKNCCTAPGSSASSNTSSHRSTGRPGRATGPRRARRPPRSPRLRRPPGLEPLRRASCRGRPARRRRTRLAARTHQMTSYSDLNRWTYSRASWVLPTPPCRRAGVPRCASAPGAARAAARSSELRPVNCALRDRDVADPAARCRDSAGPVGARRVVRAPDRSRPAGSDVPIGLGGGRARPPSRDVRRERRRAGGCPRRRCPVSATAPAAFERIGGAWAARAIDAGSTMASETGSARVRCRRDLPLVRAVAAADLDPRLAEHAARSIPPTPRPRARSRAGPAAPRPRAALERAEPALAQWPARSVASAVTSALGDVAGQPLVGAEQRVVGPASASPKVARISSYA